MNERIRELIKALNMKQAEFAKRIGVSRPVCFRVMLRQQKAERQNRR